MRLTELCEGLVDTELNSGAFPDVEISGITADSRQVKPGWLFAALPGAKADGAAFVGQAVEKGAAAVMLAAGAKADAPLAVIRDHEPRRLLALLAARFYGAAPAFTAGVTGTDGKTSTAYLCRQLWEQSEHKAASIGTLGLVCGDPALEREFPEINTTPDPVLLHSTLAKLAGRGFAHAVMEVSSIGLDQFRAEGVRFGAAAFTNLSREHLDYHKDMETYLAAKLRLFRDLVRPGGVAVINADDPLAGKVAAAARVAQLKVETYGKNGADFALSEVRAVSSGLALAFTCRGREHRLEVGLYGLFQAWNLMAALGLVLASGVEMEQALAALPRLSGVPGRLEQVSGGGAAQPLVFVDYAHTPGALENVLKALRPHVEGALCVVFGCGGDRDKGKRPEMGRIAAALADKVIVTDDNPRTEDVGAIRKAILAGCPGAREIGDRRQAIAEGVKNLRKGDVLLIAGKGHEKYQIVGDTKHPFDDVEEARNALGEVAL